MKINNPQTFDHIKAVSGETMRVKVVEIGDWNMDITNGKSFGHGLPYANIRSFSALIRNDLDLAFYPIEYPIADRLAGGRISITTTVVYLIRYDGGWFDSVEYDAT